MQRLTWQVLPSDQLTFEQDPGHQEASQGTAGAPCREKYQAEARAGAGVHLVPRCAWQRGTVRSAVRTGVSRAARSQNTGFADSARRVCPEWRTPELTYWILNVGRATVSVLF